MQNIVSSLNITFSLVLLLIPTQGVQAQLSSVQEKYSLEPKRISEDFDITASLEHPAWEEAPSVFIRHQIQPNDKETAPVQTEVKVLYSRDHLYIGFISNDPEPGKIRANITDRDSFFGDDYLGVFLDTFNNNQNAYEFFVNPLGIQADALRSGNSEDLNFDALWYSKGRETGSGYTAVIKIPFKSIDFPNQDVQNWSVQFFRNYPRENRYQLTWTDVSLNNSCLLCQSGELINIQRVESSNTVELIPYAAGTQSATINDISDPGSGLNNEPVQAKIGGSISYSPTSRSSLDAVINPDFSQVETDAAQISVNETFALFFSEKRPFFIKGNDLFNTRENLFHSRTINNPIAAAKYTQKSDNFSIAFLTAYDRNAPFIVPGLVRSSQIQSDVEAYNNVLRGKYNFGSESYVGGLITTRNHGDGSNYVGSIDWDLLIAENYYLSGQIGYSSTKELTDTTLLNDQRRFGNTSYDAAFNGEQYGGSFIETEFSRQAKYYDFSFSYSSFAPTFQTQAGFINQTDRRELEASQSVSYYPDGKFLSQGSLSVSGTWRYDIAGEFQERFVFVRLNNNLVGQNSIGINLLPVNDERFLGKMFRNIFRGTISFNSNTWDVFSFDGQFEYGRDINRTSNPTLGIGYSISANATVKPTPRFQLTMNYNYSTLSSQNGNQTHYSGDIYRLNSRYHFTSKLFARLIAEYDSFSEQIQIYPLVSYKANPFTRFYIGMTDYLNRYNQSGPNGFEGYKQTNRQFFVKFQYLIRS